MNNIDRKRLLKQPHLCKVILRKLMEENIAISSVVGDIYKEMHPEPKEHKCRWAFSNLHEEYCRGSETSLYYLDYHCWEPHCKAKVRVPVPNIPTGGRVTTHRGALLSTDDSKEMIGQ